MLVGSIISILKHTQEGLLLSSSPCLIVLLLFSCMRFFQHITKIFQPQALCCPFIPSSLSTSYTSLETSFCTYLYDSFTTYPVCLSLETKSLHFTTMKVLCSLILNSDRTGDLISRICRVDEECTDLLKLQVVRVHYTALPV